MTKKRPPTIYDVAAQADVSITTVSRVLNDAMRVAPETREKVLAAIAQLGFSPRAEAVARARRSTGRVGIMTQFFTVPSFVQRMRGIARAVATLPYEMVIYPIESLDGLHAQLAMASVTGKLDGIIIISINVDEAVVEALRASGIAVVLIEQRLEPVSYVDIDNVEGGRLAAQYLLSQGHQRFAYVGNSTIPPYSINPGEGRLAGFQQALNAQNADCTSLYVPVQTLGERITQPDLIALITAPERPTAIFAESDELALMLMRAARSINLRIPQDLALIGFDDLDIADYVGLSTIRQPLDESGQVALRLLLSHIEDPLYPPQAYLQKPSLILRETA